MINMKQRLLAVLGLLLTAAPGLAEDRGFYSIIPVIAPAMVLEAVNSGATEVTVVSIGRPTTEANQKWVVLPKGDNLYSIKPSYSSNLVLAVAKGKDKNGTSIVLETDAAKPWQLWSLSQQNNGSWELVAEGFKSTRGPAGNSTGEVFFADTISNRIHRMNLDGTVSEFVADAGQTHCVTVGADGTMFRISERSGKLMSCDAAGKGTVVMEDILGHSILARPDGSLYVTTNGDQAHGPGSVCLIRDGQKSRVDDGLKFATGMACRPDPWLLSVAEGHAK